MQKTWVAEPYISHIRVLNYANLIQEYTVKRGLRGHPWDI